MSGNTLSKTFLRNSSQHRTMQNDATITDHLNNTFDKDWQQILNEERQRMKMKEKDNKSMIHRLSGELKREQDRVLTELTS